MRRAFIALCLALACAASGAATQIGISIGINVPVYPRLVAVPGYPVYYAPGLPANYFFYDGLYWVLVGDDWYMSSWYNGPWTLVSPFAVPYYVLQVPVRYYRAPPPWFRGWAPTAPPRWGQHWGPQWEQQHRGWDRRDRQPVPRAPLPVYQGRYGGERYPPIEQQPDLRNRNYHYQPRSDVAREHYGQPPRQQPGAGAPPHQPPGHAGGQERGRGHGQDKREEGR